MCGRRRRRQNEHGPRALVRMAHLGEERELPAPQEKGQPMRAASWGFLDTTAATAHAKVHGARNQTMTREGVMGDSGRRWAGSSQQTRQTLEPITGHGLRTKTVAPGFGANLVLRGRNRSGPRSKNNSPTEADERTHCSNLRIRRTWQVGSPCGYPPSSSIWFFTEFIVRLRPG